MYYSQVHLDSCNFLMVDLPVAASLVQHFDRLVDVSFVAVVAARLSLCPHVDVLVSSQLAVVIPIL